MTRRFVGLLLLGWWILTPRHVLAAPDAASRLAPTGLAARLASLPLGFEPNWGQAEPSIRYLARTQGAMLALTDRGFVLSRRSSILRFTFGGANAPPRLVPSQQLPGI